MATARMARATETTLMNWWLRDAIASHLIGWYHWKINVCWSYCVINGVSIYLPVYSLLSLIPAAYNRDFISALFISIALSIATFTSRAHAAAYLVYCVYSLSLSPSSSLFLRNFDYVLEIRTIALIICRFRLFIFSIFWFTTQYFSRIFAHQNKSHWYCMIPKILFSGFEFFFIYNLLYSSMICRSIHSNWFTIIK